MLWGVVTFLLNYIPNIGPLISAIPPILLSLMDSAWVLQVWLPWATSS